MQPGATDFAYVQNEPTEVFGGGRANRSVDFAAPRGVGLVKSHLGRDACDMQLGATPCNRVQPGATNRSVVQNEATDAVFEFASARRQRRVW